MINVIERADAISAAIVKTYEDYRKEREVIEYARQYAADSRCLTVVRAQRGVIAEWSGDAEPKRLDWWNL